ncbi:major facilitator superfamily domain-containing protein [Aspergillus navahoensis]
MTTEETPLLAHQITPPPPSKHVLAAITSSWIATFLAAADTTITATLSSTIASEFDSLSLLSWLGTAYLLGLTITQPLSGRLSDIFGRRASFCFTCCMFTLGNVLCALAPSKGILIAARVIAGIGGGGCISISTFIISDNVTLESRGLWQGVASLVFTIGVGLGGVIGGAVSDGMGWRWAFGGIAPLSMISCVLVGIFAERSDENRSQGVRERLASVDFVGAGTLVVSLVLLLVGLNEGVRYGIAQQYMMLSTSILFFLLFLLTEWRWVTEPIIPLSLFRRRAVTLTCLAASSLSSALYILLYYVPLYMQTILHHTASQTGLRMLPYSLGSGTGSLAIGLCIRRSNNKYTLFAYLTPLCMVIAAAGFALLIPEMHWVVSEVYLLFDGVGVGGGLTTLVVALLSSVPHGMHATATAALYAFRSVGATAGLAAAGAVMNVLLGGEGRDYRDGGRGGSGQGCAVTDPCYLRALHGAFWTATGFASVALVCGFMIESRSESGEEEEEEGI